MPSMLKIAAPALVAASTAYGTCLLSQQDVIDCAASLTSSSSRLQRFRNHHHPECRRCHCSGQLLDLLG